jgi:hypothetical protein
MSQDNRIYLEDGRGAVIQMEDDISIIGQARNSAHSLRRNRNESYR